ncbi:hypothetical protein ACHQM5_009108 [Ranunculus cassubicifolius]
MEDWEDEPVAPVLKKALPKNSWDDEDVDDDEIKESWEDEEENTPVMLFPDSKCFPLYMFSRKTMFSK